jgi:hypothetical protein
MFAAFQLFRLAANACGTKTGILPSLYDPGPGFKCDADGNLDIQSLQGALVLIANVVRILIAVSGALALIAIVVSSIFFVISAGDPAKVRRARDILNNAVVGLVLIIGAYAVVTFIAKGF